MSAPDPFDLPPVWSSAVDTIKDLISGGESMLLARDLPEGPGSKVGLECYAREYCKVNTTSDLGIIYAILGVATCVAAQGGYDLQVPISGGGWLHVPAIQMALGVAPSGWGKSTALRVANEPLVSALRNGVSARRQMLPRLKNQAIQEFMDLREDESLAPDDKQFKEVFDAGLCPKTLTQDPTQEAMRNQAVNNGGHVGCLAGEADIFLNVHAYNPNGGSLSFFLNMWDQSAIDTTRVSNADLYIDEASLALAVLFQTEVFAEVTAGNSRGIGNGSDSFVSRGMFGRMWVVETDQIGDYSDLAKAYADENDFDNNHYDPTGLSTGDGEVTPLAAAAMDFAQALDDLVKDTNDYRVQKAIRRAWEVTASKYGTDMQVPEQLTAQRHVLRLDDSGLMAYRRVQRMMLVIQQHIADSEDEDNKVLWNPVASRIVQHVLREALVMTLAAGKQEGEDFCVTAEFIEDAACRILPWRWCMSANALTRRANERAEEVMATAVTFTNPKMRDLTPAATIRDLMFQLAQQDKTMSDAGILKTKLRDRIKARFPKQARNSLNRILDQALEELTADLESGITLVPGTPNALGNATPRYKVRVPVDF